MKIGEFSRRAGVSAQAVRFYERKRLLRPPLRTASGYRDYSEGQLESISFIKLCQQLGFTLPEIGELLEVHRALEKLPRGRVTGLGKRRAFQQIALKRLATIDGKIAALQKMRESLAKLLHGFECWRQQRS